MPHWECNYWNACNQPTGSVELRDPHYGTPITARIFSGTDTNMSVKFAFVEVTNGVFAVFEPV